MSIASRMGKMFSKAEVKKMDEAAKKAAGSPGYDDDTIAAQKEYAKEVRENKNINALFNKTDKELREITSKKSGDTVIGQQARNELDRRYENKMAKKGDIDSEYTSFKRYSPSESKKASDAKKTPKDERAADRDAEAFAMGKERTEKKPVKSLTAAEKKAAEESLKFSKGGAVKKMMGGGMAKKSMGYNKGGMVKANCGASMKPTQKAKK